MMSTWKLKTIESSFDRQETPVKVGKMLSKTWRKKAGQIVLDQIRTIDRLRLIKKAGSIDAKTQLKVTSVLQQLFAF